MDAYQATYDAVRSKISGGNISDAVERVCRDAFDMGMTRQIIQQEFCAAANEMQRPSVLFKPTISADGDMWCVLLGENLQIGVCGFGKTPAEAMAEFDLAFWKGQTPTANRLAKLAEADQSRTPLSAGKSREEQSQ